MDMFPGSFLLSSLFETRNQSRVVEEQYEWTDGQTGWIADRQTDRQDQRDTQNTHTEAASRQKVLAGLPEVCSTLVCFFPSSWNRKDENVRVCVWSLGGSEWNHNIDNKDNHRKEQ